MQYLGVLFHSSLLLHIFWYINHKKIKGNECIYVTIFYFADKYQHPYCASTNEEWLSWKVGKRRASEVRSWFWEILLFLVRKDMDVNEHERLTIQLYIWTQTTVKKTVLFCCSTFHNHSRVFSNKNNSYPKMSMKQPLACSWVGTLNFCR